MLTNELVHVSPYIQSFTVTVTTSGTPVTVTHDGFHKFRLRSFVPTESGSFITFSQPSISLGSFTVDSNVSGASGTLYCEAIAP